MNVLEAIEYMQKGGKVTHHKPQKNFWYQMYSNGSIVSLDQDTSCAAQILGIWANADKFVEAWKRTSPKGQEPGELYAYKDKKYSA